MKKTLETAHQLSWWERRREDEEQVSGTPKGQDDGGMSAGNMVSTHLIHVTPGPSCGIISPNSFVSDLNFLMLCNKISAR